MKKVGRPYRPKPITLVTTVFIPELAGYWRESLDILKVCLESVFENTDLPYDLLVWDNGSCTEVRDYLSDLQTEGRIHYLFRSFENVSKLGCFNAVFPGAPGEYIGYFDCDVKFYPGWLSSTMKVFETFPNVGTVTARPGRLPSHKQNLLTSTLAFAEKAGNGLIVERGDLIRPEVLTDHYQSLGVDPENVKVPKEDVRMTLGDVTVYAYGSHFQFVTKRSIAADILPLPVADLALGNDRVWDLNLGSRGYLRLALDQVYVRHMGNRLEGEHASGIRPSRDSPRAAKNVSSRSLKRRVMLKAYEMLTAALYSNSGRRSS